MIPNQISFITFSFQLLPEQQDKLRAQQLKLYEALLGGSSLRAKHLLSHQPFLKPLIDLLSGSKLVNLVTMLQIWLFGIIGTLIADSKD